MSDFDANWPHGHVTRDGRKARIVCRDVRSPHWPILALIEGYPDSPQEYQRTYTTSGHCSLHGHNGDDLINAPAPKRKFVRWMNVYGNGPGSYMYETRKLADQECGRERIACVRVEFEEGQFDD